MANPVDIGESRWVKLPSVGGLKIHYVMAGRGRPVVLLHGLGGSLVVWRDNIAALAKRYTVFALDMPGHGDSDNPAADYSLETYTAWLEAFRKSLGIGPLTVIGNSAGGLLASNYARSHRDQVEKLVLVDSAGLGRDVAWYVRLLSIPLLGEFMESAVARRPANMLRTAFADGRFATRELAMELYRSRVMKGATRAVVKPVRQIVNLFGVRREALLTNQLALLKIPTLILWGEEDRLVPVAHGIEAARRIPGARIHVFPNCGHWPQMERAEEFNKLVLEFLGA